MKYALFVAVAVVLLSGCVMKQTHVDGYGRTTDEKYIIKRPVKELIGNAEAE